MSYYKEIDGKKYDAGLIEAAEKAIAGRGDGRISQEDAEMLLKKVKDGDAYTDIEKDTVAYIREKMKWTESADNWFRDEIRKWAAEKGQKTKEAKADAAKADA
ncbi:MAG: hypothetical protein AAGE52_09980 [Myxococcota bacterium]